MLNRVMRRLDGHDQDLSEYLGKVVMIVNTASYCGNTPQYTGLENIYEKYKQRGFIILGFPANNFGAQEPGTDQEIEKFCTTNYSVTFPMFSKVSAAGANIDPLYAELTAPEPPVGGPVTWNFQKFLIDRHGKQVAMFSPRTQPEAAEVTAKIEELLDQPAA